MKKPKRRYRPTRSLIAPIQANYKPEEKAFVLEAAAKSGESASMFVAVASIERATKVLDRPL